MPRILKLLAAGVAALAVAAVLTVAALLLLPQETYRDLLIRSVSSSTGRALRIEGEFSIELGKRIAVHATNLRFANAQWGSRPAMVRIGRVDAELSLQRLFSRVIDLRLDIEAPDLWLETDAQGRGNWQLKEDGGSADPESGSGAHGAGADWVLIPEVRISDGELRFADAEGENPQQIQLRRFELAPKNANLAITLDGYYNGASTTLSGNLGDVQRLLAGNSVDVELDGSLADATLSAKGSVSQLLQAGGGTADLLLALKAPSLDKLGRLANAEVPELGALTASARVVGHDGVFAAEDLELELDGPDAKLAITGRVGDLLAASGVDIAVQAKIASLAKFSGLAGRRLPETKPLTINAKVAATEGAKGAAQISAELQSVWLSGKLQSTIAELRSARGLSAEASMTLRSLAELSSLVGQQLPAVGPITVSASFASKGATYALTTLNLELDDDSLRAHVSGAIDNLLGLKGVKLTVDGDVDSLSKLSTAVGEELPRTPPLTLKARLGADDALAGPVTITADVRSGDVKLSARGAIEDPAEPRLPKLDLALEAPSLSAIGELAGKPLGAIGPVKATTTLTASAREFTLASLALAVGKSDMAGDLKLRMPAAETRGAVSGVLRSRVLEFDELMRAVGEADQSTARVRATDGRVFSSEPLPLAGLGLFDASVTLDAERLNLRNLALEDTHAALVLDHAALRIELERARVGGRPIYALVVLEAGKRLAPVRFRFTADKVPLSTVMERDALLQGGDFYVDVDVSGAGRSVREIMAGLTGYLVAGARNTRVSSTALAIFGKDILSQINPLSARRGFSELECGALAFEIKDGLATTPKGMVFRETSATWFGSGRVNLKNERINANIESKAREGLGISAGKLASLLQLDGTLANPTLTPDPVGVAKTGIEAALAISTGGLSLLAGGLFDRATSDTGICEKILSAAIAGRDPN
jgi:uncharacterized protein involved in outer membrane biogenesis